MEAVHLECAAVDGQETAEQIFGDCSWSMGLINLLLSYYLILFTLIPLLATPLPQMEEEEMGMHLG